MSDSGWTRENWRGKVIVGAVSCVFVGVIAWYFDISYSAAAWAIGLPWIIWAIVRGKPEWVRPFFFSIAMAFALMVAVLLAYEIAVGGLF